MKRAETENPKKGDPKRKRELKKTVLFGRAYFECQPRESEKSQTRNVVFLY